MIDHDTDLAAQGFKTRLSGRYDLAGLILFGSRARGQHYLQSDADIAVLLRGHRRNSREFMQTKLAMAGIALMGNYAAALTCSHKTLEFGNLNYGNSENA